MKKKCKGCGVIMNLTKGSHADYCYDCEEQADAEWREQESNYWRDVAGSIK